MLKNQMHLLILLAVIQGEALVTRTWPSRFLPTPNQSNLGHLVVQFHAREPFEAHIDTVKNTRPKIQFVRAFTAQAGLNILRFPVAQLSPSQFIDTNKLNLSSLLDPALVTVVRAKIVDSDNYLTSEDTPVITVYSLPLPDRQLLIKEAWLAQKMWPFGVSSTLAVKALECYNSGFAHSFVHELSKRYMDESNKLFLSSQTSSYLVQINPKSNSPEALNQYRNVGRLIGYSLATGHAMVLSFIPPILKLILNKPIILKDIWYIEPKAVTLLQALLARNEKISPMTKVKASALTNSMRQIYFKDRIGEQVNAIKQGIFEVVPQNLLDMFNEEELNDLIY